MTQALQLTGQRFGRLMVIERHPENTKAGRAVWLCECDCGNQTEVPSIHLKSGHTQSCGCLRDEKIAKVSVQPRGHAALQAAYCSYRGSAKARGLIFDLSKELFCKLVVQDCYYCGAPPNEDYRSDLHSKRNGKATRNGIDRVDNVIGYIPDNLVPCCKTCNMMKKAMSQEDFLRRANAIAQRHPML